MTGRTCPIPPTFAVRLSFVLSTVPIFVRHTPLGRITAHATSTPVGRNVHRCTRREATPSGRGRHCTVGSRALFPCIDRFAQCHVQLHSTNIDQHMPFSVCGCNSDLSDHVVHSARALKCGLLPHAFTHRTYTPLQALGVLSVHRGGPFWLRAHVCTPYRRHSQLVVLERCLRFASPLFLSHMHGFAPHSPGYTRTLIGSSLSRTASQRRGLFCCAR